MPPASKVPSERELAGVLGISRGTVKQALQELEAEGYIERIPAKGSFVCDVPEGKLKQTNIILPFPEESISMEKLDYANWAADSEVYRGMMSSCGKYNTRATFQHFESTEEKGIIQKQAKELESFDGAVFMGHQLLPLKKELLKRGIPFVSILAKDSSLTIGGRVFYNRPEIIAEAGEFLCESGYKRVALLANEKEDDSRRNILSEALKKRGFFLDADWSFKLVPNEDKAYLQLKKLLPNDSGKLPDVFFCSTPVFSFAMLRLANERGWKIPDDIGIFGYGNNLSIRPTHPALSHVYVPYYEMGIEACRSLAENYLGDKVLPAKIIKGETTKTKA